MPQKRKRAAPLISGGLPGPRPGVPLTDDEYIARAALTPVASHPQPLEDADEEAAFQQWYTKAAKEFNLAPSPDDPQHFYDYRGAYKAGAWPDASKHWPSEFKLEGHPNLIVAGRDTRTGKPIVQPVASHPAEKK
jgi:hypothetical protein